MPKYWVNADFRIPKSASCPREIRESGKVCFDAENYQSALDCFNNEEFKRAICRKLGYRLENTELTFYGREYNYGTVSYCDSKEEWDRLVKKGIVGKCEVF